MNINKIGTVFVAFLTYMVMAGLLTQIGIVINPMAEHYGISVTDAASMFSFLTGGTLIGTFVAMIIFGRLSISAVLRIFYIPLIIAMFVFVSTSNAMLASAMLVIIGLGCGVGLSAGAIVISKTFDAGQRASAFLGTDCAFSASGAIFPALTTAVIAAGVSWQFGFSAVTIAGIAVLASTFFLTFPNIDQKAEQKDNVVIWTPRVFIFGAALCVYLITQNTFLAWGPTYLIDVFGTPANEAGVVVGNYWGPSVFGLILAAVLVTKIPPRALLVTVTLIAVVILTLLRNVDSASTFLTITLALGFSTSCMYKIGISVGSEQVKNAPAKLVTFLLMCGTLGSTLGPVLSAQVVSAFGVSAAISMSLVGFAAVFLLFACALIIEIKENRLNQEAYTA
ncbi:MFS transporter TsgA [Shewanella sp. 125m-1]